MNRHVRGSLLVTAALLSACATSHWVSYRQEVRAVLEKNCLTFLPLLSTQAPGT